jgi:hypothetical protein
MLTSSEYLAFGALSFSGMPFNTCYGAAFIFDILPLWEYIPTDDKNT